MSDKQETVLDDMIYVMSNHRGRRLIHTILEICQIEGHQLVVGAPDATGFNLGKADVGKQIKAFCDLDQFLLMTKEAKEPKDERTNDTNPTSGS